MKKIALITGSTDGIGKALALSLAEEGYSIHVLGRNKDKGEEVIKSLNKIHPMGEHKLYIVDLSTVENNNNFLDEYIRNHEYLDLLVLNANAMFKKVKTGKDGIDLAFIIGYISRYMFSVKLDELLRKSNDPRVVHIGGATMISEIQYTNLKTPNYKPLKATAMGFMANNLLTYHANKNGLTDVPYEFVEPGIVNTNTVKDQNIIVRFLSKIMGMIEPKEAGRLIKEHIIETQSKDVSGKFYNKKNEKQPKKEVVYGEEAFKEVLTFSKEVSRLQFTTNLTIKQGNSE